MCNNWLKRTCDSDAEWIIYQTDCRDGRPQICKSSRNSKLSWILLIMFHAYESEGSYLFAFYLLFFIDIEFPRLVKCFNAPEEKAISSTRFTVQSVFLSVAGQCRWITSDELHDELPLNLWICLIHYSFFFFIYLTRAWPLSFCCKFKTWSAGGFFVRNYQNYLNSSWSVIEIYNNCAHTNNFWFALTIFPLRTMMPRMSTKLKTCQRMTKLCSLNRSVIIYSYCGVITNQIYNIIRGRTNSQVKYH